MSLLLTVYNTPTWKTFVNVSGLPVIDEATLLVNSNTAILQPAQSLPIVSALLSGLSSGQTLWIAVVQAEHFLANVIENGNTLEEAAQAWEQLTNGLLGLQRQQRKKLHLFNLHQALAQPTQLRLLLSSEVVINDYSEQSVNSNLSLLAACQYLVQRPELQALNIRLQASVLPLCDSEKLILNIDQILLQSYITCAAANERDVIQSQLQQVQEQLESNLVTNAAQLTIIGTERDREQQMLREIETALHTEQKVRIKFESNLKTTIEERDSLLSQLHQMQDQLKQFESDLKSTSEERDLLLSQLHQVQEQLEQYYLSLQTEQQSNKHALLARDKQQAKEITKLEAELRKTKARAANAEFAGQLLQQELDKLRKSISWKAATPVRALGRLVRKNDPAREKLVQDIGLLLTSEYFDVDWYMRTYTDVTESQINPAEHYLLHGAAEGRLPGPLFDGNWYLQHYPDVSAANMNPLLHFILYGQQEGRNSSPILLTNNSQDVEEQN